MSHEDNTLLRFEDAWRHADPLESPLGSSKGEIAFNALRKQASTLIENLRNIYEDAFADAYHWKLEYNRASDMLAKLSSYVSHDIDCCTMVLDASWRECDCGLKDSLDQIEELLARREHE